MSADSQPYCYCRNYPTYTCNDCEYLCIIKERDEENAELKALLKDMSDVVESVYVSGTKFVEAMKGATYTLSPEFKKARSVKQSNLYKKYLNKDEK